MNARTYEHSIGAVCIIASPLRLTYIFAWLVCYSFWQTAERNKLDDILTILKESGGRNSKLAEMEERGELFGGIAAANQNTEQRRELAKVVKENEQTIKDEKAAEAAAKAEGAQSEMGKAMSALVERGEKIERLDQKTQDLESEAQNYAGLAARLKEEVKNKKWYQL